MKRAIMILAVVLFIPVAVFFWAMAQSVACPYDGWPAWATGLKNGSSCEYSHWQQGEQHKFWTYCQ